MLPTDGMQEVRSSNLLSSTGQKHNSNRSNSKYSSKVQQRRPGGPPLVCSDRASSTSSGCWHDSGFQALNQRWAACHLGKPPLHRSGDSCHRSPAGPSRGRCLPVAVAASANGAGRHGGRVGSAAAPAGQGRAFADRGLGAWARRAAPVVSARRWARWCAAPLRRPVAPRCRPCAPAGALLRHMRNPARPGARHLGRAQAGGPPTQGFDAAPARSPPLIAGGRDAVAELAPCRSPRR